MPCFSIPVMTCSSSPPVRSAATASRYRPTWSEAMPYMPSPAARPWAESWMYPDPGDDLLQLAAGPVGSHRLAIPADLVGGHAVHAVAGREALGGKLDVPTAEHRAQVRLVRGLVLAEPDVAVRAEDLRLAELRPELVQQLHHRAQDLLLVDRLPPGPVRLGVVGLQTLVEVQCLLSPPTEGHDCRSFPIVPACPGSPRRGQGRARWCGGRRTWPGAATGRARPAPWTPRRPGSPRGSRRGPGPGRRRHRAGTAAP